MLKQYSMLGPRSGEWPIVGMIQKLNEELEVINNNNNNNNNNRKLNTSF
jgi:hypothetical protein